MLFAYSGRGPLPPARVPPSLNVGTISQSVFQIPHLGSQIVHVHLFFGLFMFIFVLEAFGGGGDPFVYILQRLHDTES